MSANRDSTGSTVLTSWSTGTSLSWTHTSTNSGLYAPVGLVFVGAASAAPTAATWNSVAMTNIDSYTDPDGNKFFSYYIANPGLGAQTVAFTWAGSQSNINGVSVLYTGGSQTGIPDSHATGHTTTGTTYAASTTTVANNAQIAGLFYNNSGATNVAASTNTTVLLGTGATIGLMESSSLQTPAGSKSLNLTGTSGHWSSLVVSLAPASTASLLFASASSQYARRTASNTGFPATTSHKTIEAWVKFTSLPSSGAAMEAVCIGDDATNNGGFNLAVKNVAGTIVGYTDVYNRTIAGTLSLGISTGTWYHYAITYDGTNMNWYINGVLIDSAAAGTITAASATVGVGSRVINPAYGEYIDGRVYLARVWATDRSAAQLAANKCIALGTTANLAAEWKLDGGYTDNSGNGNTLAATASPVFGVDSPAICTASVTNNSYQMNMM